MQFGISITNFYQPALLGVAILLSPIALQAQDNATVKQPVMSDAQVEANVLKALAGAQELSDKNITTTTVYGVVTLSGAVPDEPTRVLAETLASRASGVKKVVDEITLGASTPASVQGRQDDPNSGTNPNLQSDGTIATNGASAPPPDQQQNPQPYSPAYSNQNQPQYPQQAQQPYQQQPYPQSGQAGAPVARQSGPYANRPYGPPPSVYSQAQPPYGAQEAGIPVVIPSGSMVRIRINEGLDSKHSQPGNVFDGTVLNDVVADGAVAIPRGAAVQGTVVDVKASGALKGRGELSLQLTHVTLGGKVFPVVTDRWSNVGPDKTGHTVSNAVALGAVGALIGAVAGGGPGAAIGAGVGGVAGIGTSAASGGGQAMIPPEAILTFHLTQAAQVATVSQAEMDRLGYGVPVGSQPRLVRRSAQTYYGPYGPGAYPRPYPAYSPYPY